MRSEVRCSAWYKPHTLGSAEAARRRPRPGVRHHRSHPGSSGSSLHSGPGAEHWSPLPSLPCHIADLRAIPSLPPTCPQAGASFLKPTQGLSLSPGPSGSCLLLAWPQKGTPQSLLNEGHSDVCHRVTVVTWGSIVPWTPPVICTCGPPGWIGKG